MLHINMLLAGLPLYLDPGSGSLLIQLLLAAILGIGVGVRMYWAKLKGFFGKKKDSSGKVEDGDNE